LNTYSKTLTIKYKKPNTLQLTWQNAKKNKIKINVIALTHATKKEPAATASPTTSQEKNSPPAASQMT